jgi:predicted alpha-1,2-mannosidase
MPRGMTYWTPQSSESSFIFDRRCPTLSGIRATHSPSPWMGDYGHFDITPFVGELGRDSHTRRTAFSLTDSTIGPHRFNTTLPRHQVGLDMSATDRCAILRLTFPNDLEGQAGLALQVGVGTTTVASTIHIEDDGQTVVGVSRANHGGVPSNFGCWFVVKIDSGGPIDFGTFTSDQTQPGGRQVEHLQAGIYIRPQLGRPITLRIGTSFISADQAWLNLERETKNRDLDAVAEASAKTWSDWLDRLPCPSDDPTEQRKFASAMYRVGMFPMKMHECDANHRTVHYSPYDGCVHEGVLYVNNGFWDTYRTVYPLLARIDPEGYGEIIDGFLMAYREGGWLPKWTSPGYRSCMVSTHIDAVIAEAFAWNIEGFDREEAYEAIRQNAFEPGDVGGRWGRLGLSDYLKLGYVPEQWPHSVCRTLDFAYCDWCIAQVANQVGRSEDAAALMKRSQNYRHLWHKDSGFMRPRRADGSWVEPWNQWDWAKAYIEGGPWQHSWTVPHDVEGLARLAGGRDALGDRLEAVFSTPPRFEIGDYPEEIHEMTEMALARDADGTSFGQYAHSNQPSHGMLWMLQALGRQDFAKQQIDRVCHSLYSVDDLPGDEDNGEMAAWYLLNQIGQPRLCPGTPGAETPISDTPGPGITQ